MVQDGPALLDETVQRVLVDPVVPLGLRGLPLPSAQLDLGGLARHGLHEGLWYRGLPEGRQALEDRCYPVHMCRSGEEPDISPHLS